MRIIKIVFLWLLFTVPIFAVPTIYGPTGLITIPTAESLKYKEFNFGIDYNVAVKSLDATHSRDTYFYKMNIGTFKGWELGVVGGSKPTDGVYVNAKYYLMSDESRYPISIAIGGENIASTSNTSIYLVASKKFEGGFSGHFGFRANISDKDASIMTGMEYFVNDQFSLLSDVSGSKKAFPINVGMRYIMAPDLVLKVSFLGIGDTNSEAINNYYSIGLAYSKFL